MCGKNLSCKAPHCLLSIHRLIGCTGVKRAVAEEPGTEAVRAAAAAAEALAAGGRLPALRPLLRFITALCAHDKRDQVTARGWQWRPSLCRCRRAIAVHLS